MIQLALDLSWLQILCMYLAVSYTGGIPVVRRLAGQDVFGNCRAENITIGTVCYLLLPAWLPFYFLSKLLFAGVNL